MSHPNKTILQPPWGSLVAKQWIVKQPITFSGGWVVESAKKAGHYPPLFQYHPNSFEQVTGN